ncbi:hypothetical protein A1O3_04759 [Capronia epimyces CBS 606.96]|uniref:Xylanolytic transcriptional activator regulatory domain-containing protein n=1 Tax=Capronia epimyces CBS 606.96 TaxID=1182542 RepID=W9XU52_9EURO|nr:uncharacterized protein A1O3_04759 [Capronia epimyces CBS 606.96]EXJ84092.1 hypothetical protein A1O3_04759 [Capronia epimyces CBS 606.96]
MFSIYTLAVTSISSDQCQASFGDTRDALLTRYRAASLQALVAADFLTTKEFEVLQALVLFLLADPESELTSTLTGAAIRLGQKMGLHRDESDPKISFFEREMRIRLWWWLCGLDSRNRAVWPSGLKIPLPELGEIRLPLNINDADLHPDMVEPPVEYNRPTEMMCVLMKYEVSNWLRSSPTSAKVFDAMVRGPVRDRLSLELEEKLINELEDIYQEKYLRHADKRIPLHNLTCAMATLALARMRFKAHHPRGRAAAGDGEVYMTGEEGELLFASAVTWLEMMDVAAHSQFASYLVTHMTTRFQMDAYIHIISDLRQRLQGDRVVVAWKLVEDLYNEHPELMHDAENTFIVALGDLTLEAWEMHRKELLRQGSPNLAGAPQFIQRLWDQRQSGAMHMPTLLDPYALDALGKVDDNDFDWDCWNDFLGL